MDIDGDEQTLLDKLLSLGFEYEACQQVVELGFTDVNMAVDRLLNDSSPSNQSVAASTPTESSFRTPELTPTLEESTDQNISIQTSQSVLQSEDGDVLKSRYEPNEEQKLLRERFYEKERLEAQSSYKKQRLEDKKAKMRILDEIEQDRKEKKLSLQAKPAHVDKSPKTTRPMHLSSMKSGECALLIRLPTGSSKKLNFSKDVHLSQVLSSLLSDDLLDATLQYNILQSFPKKIYSADEMNKTLEELHLCPSSMLIVQLVKQPSDHALLFDTDTGHHLETEVSNSSSETEAASSHPETEAASDVEMETNNESSRTASDAEITHNPSDQSLRMRSRLLNLKKDAMDQSSGSQDQPARQNDLMQADDVREHANDRSRNTLFADAMKKRFQAKEEAKASDGNAEHHIHRNIPSLQSLCSSCVAFELSKLTTHIVNSMSKLQSKAANQVITALKDKKMFNHKLLQLFIPCKLQELKLDFYVLCANDIIEKLRFHTTLKRLSLISAICITDKSLQLSLKALTHLEYLNLTGCEKLTSDILNTIKDLPRLKVLVLDKVKISNESLQMYLGHTPHLIQLSLNYCPINEHAFQHAPRMNTLVNLSLNHTKVACCDFLYAFPNLMQLNLRNTLITDDQLVYIQQIKKIEILELFATPVTNEGLKHLNGLSIQKLALPNRTTVNDETIAIIKGLPLSILDLSDHISITNASLKSIATMTSLVNLSLSNTKITDEAFACIENLKQLEVLNVSRCNLTNNIAFVLKSLPSIHTLNLSSTKIDDDIIPTLTKCQNIYKLNLSRTSLTNKMCVHFKLNYLNTLLLDNTEVTWEGVQQCVTNCRNLMMVRNSKYHVLINKTS